MRYMKLPNRNENCSDGDREFSGELFQQPDEPEEPDEPESDIDFKRDSLPEIIADEVSEIERNRIFYILGYCLHSLRKSSKLCDKCIEAIEGQKESSDASLLTILKEYKPGSLTRV